MNRAKTLIAAVALVSFFAGIATAQQDFSFSTPDGQTLNLSGLRGNVVVLLFSGVQDPQLREELKATFCISLNCLAVNPAKAKGFFHRIVIRHAGLAGFFLVIDEPYLVFARVVFLQPFSPLIAVLGVIGFGHLHGSKLKNAEM